MQESNKITLIYYDKRYTYDNLLESSNYIKENLLNKNTKRILLCAENRPEWIFVLLATWKNNGTLIPIDYLLTKDEIKYIIEDSKPHIIFYSNSTKENVKNAIIETNYKDLSYNLDEIEVKISEDKINSNLKNFSIDNFDKDQVALILYTSGTTGNPKGVMLSFKNLLSNIKGITAANIANKDDIILLFLPLHHSYPLMMLLVSLYVNATIVILSRVNKDEIFSALKGNKVTLFIGVPRIFELIYRGIYDRIIANKILKTLFNLSKLIPSNNLKRLIFKPIHERFGGNIRYLISGGAKLDVNITKFFNVLGFTILEGYGLTETSPVVSFNKPNELKIGSVGKPLNDVEVKILDDEVLVKGNNVMMGYLNNPEKTQEIIKDGWLYTGDTGYIDDQGFLFITGRKKDIIVLSSGKNINPEDIENQILKISPLIKELAIIEENDRLKALIYPDLEFIKREKIINIHDKIKWDIIDLYNRTAPSYKKISSFEILNEELPKTRLGKIKRFLLKNYTKKQTIQPKTETKEINDEIYLDIKNFLSKLTNSQVTPNSHIELDLGLDSLDKVELISYIENKYSIHIEEDKLTFIQEVKDIYEFIKKNQYTKISNEEISWQKILQQDIVFDINESSTYLLSFKKIIEPLIKSYFTVHIKGTQNLLDCPCIFAPNHQSYLDAFVIIVSLPDNILKNTYFIASDVCFKSNLRKKIARNFHTIVMNKDENLKLSLLKCAYVLKKGYNLVIFPEGAITRDGNLTEFKPAFAILSKVFNIPIIPARLMGLYTLYKIHDKFPKRGKISIEFLHPLYPDNQSIQEITQNTFNEIQKGYINQAA